MDKSYTKVKNKMRAAEDLKERIRATTETSDGSIYFSTDSGRIYLLSYNK